MTPELAVAIARYLCLVGLAGSVAYFGWEIAENRHKLTTGFADILGHVFPVLRRSLVWPVVGREDEEEVVRWKGRVTLASGWHGYVIVSTTNKPPMYRILVRLHHPAFPWTTVTQVFSQRPDELVERVADPLIWQAVAAAVREGAPLRVAPLSEE